MDGDGGMNATRHLMLPAIVAFLIATIGCDRPERVRHNQLFAEAEATRDARTRRAQPDYLPELAAAGLGTYAREDPLADSFSIERAAAFMDGVAVSWGERFGCVTCHTNGFYLTLPASLFSHRTGYQQVQEDARTFIRSWPSVEDAQEEDTYLEDTYVVATGAFLAISELQRGDELSAVTIEALDRAWALQEPEGHWPNWVASNWPPFESDYHFGVTLMAIVGGIAPDSYMETTAARQGMARIRRYLAENETKHVHHRGMMLWAARHVDGLVTEEQRRFWVEELRGLQRDDGGWASGDLGVWRQGDGSESNPWVNVESDGYGTGFVMFVLMQSGVSASDPAIQRGIEWLVTHQRSRGYWWTQSLKNVTNTANFLTHAGTTFALKALEAAGVTDSD